MDRLERLTIIESMTIEDFVELSADFIEYLASKFEDDSYSTSQQLYKYIVGTIQKRLINDSMYILDYQLKNKKD